MSVGVMLATTFLGSTLYTVFAPTLISEMPYYKLDLKFSEQNRFRALEQFYQSSIPLDDTGETFVFEEEGDVADFDRQPYYMHVPMEKEVMYRPLLLAFKATQVPKPSGGRYVLMIGVQGIMEEHGFPAPEY